MAYRPEDLLLWQQTKKQKQQRRRKRWRRRRWRILTTLLFAAAAAAAAAATTTTTSSDVGLGCRFRMMGIPRRPRVSSWYPHRDCYYVCQCGRFAYRPCAAESHSWFLRTRPLFVSTTTFIVSPRNQDHKSAVSVPMAEHRVTSDTRNPPLCPPSIRDYILRQLVTLGFPEFSRLDCFSAGPPHFLPIDYPVMDPVLTVVHAASTPSAATASTHAGSWRAYHTASIAPDPVGINPPLPVATTGLSNPFQSHCMCHLCGTESRRRQYKQHHTTTTTTTTNNVNTIRFSPYRFITHPRPGGYVLDGREYAVCRRLGRFSVQSNVAVVLYILSNYGYDVIQQQQEIWVHPDDDEEWWWYTVRISTTTSPSPPSAASAAAARSGNDVVESA